MSQQQLNIVRDLWWLMPSGDNYWTSGSGDLSSMSKGLYKEVVDVIDDGSDIIVYCKDYDGGVSVTETYDATAITTQMAQIMPSYSYEYGYIYFDLDTILSNGSEYNVYIRHRDAGTGFVYGTGRYQYSSTSSWSTTLYTAGSGLVNDHTYDDTGDTNINISGTDWKFENTNHAIVYDSNHRYLWLSTYRGMIAAAKIFDAVAFSSTMTAGETYIVHHGSGVALTPGAKGVQYVTKLEANNKQPSRMVVTIEAEPAGDHEMFAKCYYNSIDLGTVGPFASGSAVTNSGVFDLTATQVRGIINGRTQDLYDYFAIVPYCSSGTINNSSLNNLKIHDIDIYQNYEEDWNNYEDVGYESFHYPDSLGFRGGNSWIDQNDNVVNSSGVYLINVPPSGSNADDDYMIMSSPPSNKSVWPNTGYLTNITVPSGGLSLYYNITDPSPMSTLTRAQLSLRMSLPPSGEYENARDCFQVHGYNQRFKDGDYINEMSDAEAYYSPQARINGYVLYGAGEIVEQSGFKNYTTELNFIDGGLLNIATSGNLSTTDYRVVDIFNNLELQLVGLPSGVQLSAAELSLVYRPNLFLPLVINCRGETQTVNTYVDSSGYLNTVVGNGKWHHRGTLNEADIWDAFYRNDETSGTLLTPITNDGTFTNASGEYQDIAGTPTEPTRYNYYRDPAPTLSTYYRDAVNLYNRKIDFEDRIDVGQDFAMYFLVGGSGSPSTWGGTIARIWDGTNKELELYMYNGATGGTLACDIYYSDSTSETFTTTINTTESEPVAIVLCGGYLNTLGYSNSTFALYSHSRLDNYFNNNWQHDSTVHTSPIKYRKSVTGSYLELGGSPKPAYSAYNNLYLMEFGYASGWLPMTTNVSSNALKDDYAYSDEANKKFFASRLLPNYYLEGSGVNWVVNNGSGEASWQSDYPLDDWLGKERLIDINFGLTKGFTNYINNPSGITVSLLADNHTSHPSGTDVIVDIRLNQGAMAGWKIWRTEFNLPSGTNQNITQGFTKHIGLQEGPLSPDEIDSIRLRLNTKNSDIGSTEYYTDLTIKSLNVGFDSFIQSSGTTSTLNLMTSGDYQRATENLDLYLFNNKLGESLNMFSAGHLTSSGIMNLYTMGGFAQKTLNLLSKGHLANSGTLDLYIGASVLSSGISELYPSGLTLYTNATYRNNANIPLYIGGLAGTSTTNTLDMFMFSTEHSGVRVKMPLYVYCGYDPDLCIPLYIKVDEYGTTTNRLNLYVDSDSTIFKKLPLFTHGTNNPVELE